MRTSDSRVRQVQSVVQCALGKLPLEKQKETLFVFYMEFAVLRAPPLPSLLQDIRSSNRRGIDAAAFHEIKTLADKRDYENAGALLMVAPHLRKRVENEISERHRREVLKPMDEFESFNREALAIHAEEEARVRDAFRKELRDGFLNLHSN